MSLFQHPIIPTTESSNKNTIGPTASHSNNAKPIAPTLHWSNITLTSLGPILDQGRAFWLLALFQAFTRPVLTMEEKENTKIIDSTGKK